MKFRSRNRISEVLAQGFQNRAVTWLPTFGHQEVLTQLLSKIDDKLKISAGPLFFGEAEKLILMPLYNLACGKLRIYNDAGVVPDYTMGSVVKTAYSSAAAYAVISEFTKIAQSKDVANAISSQAMEHSPIYQSLKSASGVTPADKEREDARTKTWAALDQFMGHTNAVGTIAKFLTLSTDETKTVDSTVQAYYLKLLATHRRGKGMHVESEAREDLITKRSVIRAAINAMIASGDEEGEESNTHYAEAITAAYWFLNYLEVTATEEDYNMHFPKGQYISQSQQYVEALRSSSTKLMTAFSDIAVAAFSFDIQIATLLYNEVENFYRPVILQTSKLDDAKLIWDKAQSSFDRVSNKFAVDAAKYAVATLKQYADADYVLTSPFQKAIDTIMADIDFTVKGKTEAQIESVIKVTAEKLLHDTNATKTYEIELSSNNLMLNNLLIHASNIIDAIDYLVRARALIMMDYERDSEYQPLIPGGLTFSPVVPLTGKVGLPTPATFERVSPIVLNYPKYTYNDNEPMLPVWTMSPYLAQPVYQIPMLQSKIANDDMMIWPLDQDIPMGDPITRDYAKMPIPACYTRTRNAALKPYKMSTVVDLLSGLFEKVPSGRVFTEVATLLHNHYEEYGRPLLDYLSSSMLVHKVSGGKATVLVPSIPAIYGFPTAAVVAKNTKDRKTPDQLVALVEQDMAAKVTIKSTTYFFVLHAKYPRPYSAYPVPYSPSKGVTLSVPVNHFSMDALIAEKADKGGNREQKGYPTAATVSSSSLSDAGMTDSAAWLDPIAWSPFVTLLPHICYEVISPSQLTGSVEFLKFAVASVRTKVCPISGDLRLAGFVDVEAVMLDMDDYDEALSQPDPVPTSRSASIVDPLSIKGGEEAIAAEVDERELISQTLRGNNAKQDAEVAAAKVTQAPVLHTAAEDIAASKDTIAKTAGQLTIEVLQAVDRDEDLNVSTPLQGDAANDTEEATPDKGTTPADGDSKATLKYYMKTEDDGTITVYALPADQPAPKGATLVSQQEYDDLIKKGAIKG